MGKTESVIVASTRNQLNIDTTVSRIFVFGNETSYGTFTNSTGGDLELKEGTLLGKIAATGLLVVMKSAAVDGSQLPVGVLLGDIDIVDTASAQINYVVNGDVVEERLIFDGADDLDTVVQSGVFDPGTGDATFEGGKTYREWIASNTVGIRLINKGDDLSDHNNS